VALLSATQQVAALKAEELRAVAEQPTLPYVYIAFYHDATIALGFRCSRSYSKDSATTPKG
jgi:hypothetical protein